MKKWLISLIVIVLLLTVSSFIFTYPHERELSSSIKGVEFQLGTGNNDVRSITINIAGKIHYSLLKKITFKGTIILEGMSDSHNKQLEMRVYQTGKGLMAYMMEYARVEFTEPNSGGVPIFADPNYGMIFASYDFSKVAIERKSPDGGWSSTNGLIVSGPSESRSGALEIANELTKSFYNKLHGTKKDAWLE